MTATLNDDATSTASIQIGQLRARLTQPYSAGYSAFSTFTGSSSVTSQDSYVTISLANCSRSRNSRQYFTTSYNNNAGTITVTPANGMTITRIEITYANTRLDTGLTVNDGSILGTEDNKRIWTGDSTSAVTFTSSIVAIQAEGGLLQDSPPPRDHQRTKPHI